MKDDFEATFVVDLAPDDVWEAMTSRTVEADPTGDGDVHYVLAGWSSFESLPHKVLPARSSRWTRGASCE